MKDRNLILHPPGLWLRLYIGSTGNRRRLRPWSFPGVSGRVNHGITLRLRGEQCIGMQWRRR